MSALGKERIQGVYSVDHQGIRVRYSKRFGFGRNQEEVREFIAYDGDEDYNHVHDWLKGNPHTYCLGTINLEVNEQILAEFNRLYAKRNPPLPNQCPNCRAGLLTTREYDKSRRQYHTVCVPCGYVIKSVSERDFLAAQGPIPLPDTRTARGRNHTHAKEFALRALVGRTVHVYKLGGVRPEDDPDTELYLPLPEYGIVLVTFKNPCQRLGTFEEELGKLNEVTGRLMTEAADEMLDTLRQRGKL